MAAIITRGTSQIPREEVSVVDMNGASTANLPTRGLRVIQKISIVSNGADAYNLTVNETFANGVITCATKGIIRLAAGHTSTSKFLVTVSGY